MQRSIPRPHPRLWAPDAICRDGKYYLYFAAVMPAMEWRLQTVRRGRFAAPLCAKAGKHEIMLRFEAEDEVEVSDVVID